jgi:predicted MFS family arabinose efflux permease
LGLVGIGAGVGFFVGPLYAGWRAGMLEPVLGAAAWRRPVIEMGILGIVVAAIFAWMADEERPVPAGERKTVPSGKLFPTPALWFFFLAYCFAFSVRDFAGSSMSSLSSLFLQNACGYGPKWTGLALSGIFVAAILSNPLFGILSDGGRKRWITFALVVAAVMIVIFPHVPSRWTIPVLVVYGFFFMATYPMTEAALMESVPDAVRGRVFGLFVMGGGVIGNLSHWAVGVKVKHLGEAAHSVNAYFSSYLVVALLALASLLGLLCLPAIQRREGSVTHKPAEEDSMPLLT